MKRCDLDPGIGIGSGIRVSGDWDPGMGTGTRIWVSGDWDLGSGDRDPGVSGDWDLGTGKARSPDPSNIHQI